MRKGTHIGTYEGSVSDKVLAYLDRGVNDLVIIGKELGYTPNELRRALYHWRKRGLMSVQKMEIVTLKGVI